MKRDEIQRAVAEAMGWTIHQIETCSVQDVVILPPGVSINDDGAVFRYAGIQLPDLTLDLAAECRKTLTPAEQREFGDHLSEILTKAHGFPTVLILYTKTPWSGEYVFKIADATAEQQFKAYLRTKQLWKEDV